MLALPIAIGCLSILLRKYCVPRDAAGRFVFTLEGASILSNDWFAAAMMLGVVFLAVQQTVRKRQTVCIALFIACICPLTFGISYASWQEKTSDSYYRALRKLHHILPENCIVMGSMAGNIALEHRCKCYGWPTALDGKNPPPDYISC